MNDVKNISNYSSRNAMEVICEQHVDKFIQLTGKLPILSKKLVELLDWKSLLNLSLVSKSCSATLKDIKRYINPSLENHVDLSLPVNLKKCLAPNFKEEAFVREATKLVKQFYEVSFRTIKDSKYGLAFPLNSELLYYAMFLAKNETVLEIGGASGENAALLAFSGAKHVYMNDIVPNEVESFKGLCKQLPSQVQEKTEPVLGNCFELLKLKPELKGKVGLLLCNNLIHFFNDKERESFFELIKAILKPGGRAIFTANTCYSFSECKGVLDLYPERTAWKFTRCLVYNYHIDSKPVKNLYYSTFVASPEQISVNYRRFHLWLKKTDTDWVANEEGYNELPKHDANKVKSTVTKNLEEIKKTIRSGSVQLLVNTLGIFRQESISTLCKEHGFEVEKTCLIKRDGHLFLGDDPWNGDVGSVGIIIKAPNEKL